MTHASLFSGIGGFDYAAEACGFENIFQVEINEAARKRLEKNFPNVKRYGDIKNVDFTKYRGAIDVLSGGFPCQPFSLAGKRKGREDDRAIFDEMFRAIREVQPNWVLAENVYGILSIENGDYFEEISSLLESEGYEVQSYIIPASAVGAPHRRNRLWIVAKNTVGIRRFSSFGEEKSKTWRFREFGSRNLKRVHREKAITYAESSRRERNHKREEGRRRTEFVRDNKAASDTIITRMEGELQQVFGQPKRINESSWQREWIEVAAEFCRVDDGVSDRVDRLKMLGNAIVPQVAMLLFETIKEIDEKEKK